MIVFDIESAKLVSFGNVSPDASWSLPKHSHNYWEFIYFVRGSGRVDVPMGTLRPQQYHILVYPPGLPHAESSNPADPEETIYLGVEVPGTPPIGAHLLIPDPAGEMRWLFERIVRECLLSGVTQLAETYMQAFLHLLERSWDSGTPVPHDIVDAAIQYLHENYSRDINLQVLSEVIHISETHLSHKFSAKVGVSPLRYLHHIRIEAAKRLLCTTSIPVNEVAQKVGFADPLYFSRAFKRSTGLSPSKYREQSNCTI